MEYRSMKERPILMNGEMVRAILEGRKTQTRRVLNSTGLAKVRSDGLIDESYRPYGQPEDRLWVKETWTAFGDSKGCMVSKDLLPSREIIYRADHPLADGPWRTPIFMPRWASRITLEITDVRVQRLQDISEEDAIAEGVSPQIVTEKDIQDTINGTSEPHIKELARILGPGQFTAKFKYQELWDSINAKRGFGWDSNPWVWALTFKRLS
jgi:hypothetical protein